MAVKNIELVKNFNNIDDVFNAMLDAGFFVNEAHKASAQAEVADHWENWYSNGVVEVKIYRSDFEPYRLSNFRGIRHQMIDDLFAVASL